LGGSQEGRRCKSVAVPPL